MTDSTELGESLDPEALRALLATYFEQMKAAAERHGGVVEKFIGDAVMAVFGVPAVHEDDALRALRAAPSRCATRSPELGIEGGIGVESGEVVVGDCRAAGDRPRRHHGGAARAGGAAGRDPARRRERSGLPATAVSAEPLEPLVLKGKPDPVPGWRLVSVSPGRHCATPTRRSSGANGSSHC